MPDVSALGADAKALLSMALVVWLGTQGLVQALKWKGKALSVLMIKRLALIFGLAGGAILYGTGLLEISGTGVWGWIYALFLGAMGTMLAGLTHDKVIKPLLPQRK